MPNYNLKQIVDVETSNQLSVVESSLEENLSKDYVQSNVAGKLLLGFGLCALGCVGLYSNTDLFTGLGSQAKNDVVKVLVSGVPIMYGILGVIDAYVGGILESSKNNSTSVDKLV